ncbi:MAG: hypothetical protein OXG15_01235 [Gammaproteobacteria bacterium]|nr:hypothetical protein [Gammaproteobacteria bacterium]
MRRILLGLWITVCFAATSCGFALRTESVGDRLSGIELPVNLPRDVQVAIERQARVFEVALVGDAETDAQNIAGIEEFENDRTTRVDPSGRPIEYWISVRWDVVLASQSQSPLVLHASESVGLDETSLIGFEKEKSRIKALLREELANQLITRLALINDAAKAPQ